MRNRISASNCRGIVANATRNAIRSYGAKRCPTANNHAQSLVGKLKYVVAHRITVSSTSSGENNGNLPTFEIVRPFEAFGTNMISRYDFE
jgi:hypothetical protein